MEVFFKTILGLAFYLILTVGIWIPIFKKAGYSWTRGILMAVPVVNLVLLIAFAAQDWPVLQEFRGQKARTGALHEDEAYLLLKDATRLEHKGKAEEALSKYNLIVSGLPGTTVARDAEISIKKLKETLG